LGGSYLSDQYSVCGKRPLAIAAMNAELPPFKNGEHNPESASTIDRVITPLMNRISVKLVGVVRARVSILMMEACQGRNSNPSSHSCESSTL